MFKAILSIPSKIRRSALSWNLVPGSSRHLWKLIPSQHDRLLTPAAPPEPFHPVSSLGVVEHRACCVDGESIEECLNRPMASAFSSDIPRHSMIDVQCRLSGDALDSNLASSGNDHDAAMAKECILPGR